MEIVAIVLIVCIIGYGFYERYLQHKEIMAGKKPINTLDSEEDE